MSVFMNGFSDELMKTAGIGSLLWKGLTAYTIGSAGYKGYKAAKAGRNFKKWIPASGGSPSRAWYINYHKALGLPRKMSKLERRRQSLNFAKYREQK